MILMLAVCASQQHKACYSQIATFTADEVFTGSMGESEQKIGGVTWTDALFRLW